MMRRPRIVHVINDLSTGGAESMLVRLALSLRGEFDQHVVCLLEHGALASLLSEQGVRVTALGTSRRFPSPAVVPSLVRLLRRERPDIVQTWLYQSDLVGGIAARMAGVRSLAWNLRGADISPTESHPLTRVIVRVCSLLSAHLPNRIVCCAQSVAADHRERGYDASRMIVIENGVDLTRFQPDLHARSAVRAELGVCLETPLIGHVARFHPQKDHETLFAAIKHYQSTSGAAHFVLVGPKILSDEPRIRELLGRYGISSGVHCLGERHDIQRIHSALDIATSSSAWGEGFPNVLCEAMACGVPCVATDSGDASHILGGTGRVVPRRDPEALASAWTSMLSLGSERLALLGTDARERAMELFDQQVCAERYAVMYRELASGCD